MAGICPHCGASNPDDLPFCNSCGEPIQADLRLIMDMKNAANRQPQKTTAARRGDDDDFQIDNGEEADEKSFPVLPVVLTLAAAAALLWFIFFR